MAAIDVGPGATNRATNVQGFSLVSQENPANLSGVIDHIDLWLAGYSSGTVDFAAFVDNGSNSLTTNGTAAGLTPASGDNDFDAPGDFTAFDIGAGEYLGVFIDANKQIEADTSGGGNVWYKALDQIPCTGVTFAVLTSWAISIYGTGVEASAGYTPRLMMVT